jgi:DNA-binding NtrC family response regulator
MPHELGRHEAPAQRPFDVVFSSPMPLPKPLILVLEDDAASAEALSMVLADWGAEVVHALNADKISGVVGSRLPEIRYIIADYNLGPGPDGVTLVQRLMQLNPHVRVLVLSGSFHGRALEAAVRIGLDVMQKPANPQAILAWLEQT